MPEADARVILLCLDGVNHAAVTPEQTPGLWALGAGGGRAPTGGRGDLPAVTYVSHATLFSGATPEGHGVWSNAAVAPKGHAVTAWAGRPRIGQPTLFSALRRAGHRTAAICGDQYLVPLLGDDAPDLVWPPGGGAPAPADRCASGYARNAAVRAPLLDAIAATEFTLVFGHLNEPDTWGHRLGPHHAETRRVLRETDALVGEVVALARRDWARTIIIVISDHGMEPVAPAAPIDLLAHAMVTAAIAAVVPDGGVALVRLREGIDPARAGAALRTVPGVAGWRAIRPGVWLVIGAAGHRFAVAAATGADVPQGVHGGPGTTTTVALVGGGHPAVPRLARMIAARPPHLADWASTIAALGGVAVPGATGRNLMA